MSLSDASASASALPMSKAEAKQLKKQQRRVQNKEKNREKKRQTKKRKQDARRELLESMGPEARQAFIQEERERGKVRKEEEVNALKSAYASGAPKVVVNCSFSDNMDSKELSSLVKQVQLSYTAVRDQRARIQLHLSSLGESNPAYALFDRMGCRNWFVHFHAEPVWELFDTSKLVVLSPDATEDLEAIEEDKIYVIGGLVDRSVKKGETRSQAETLGLGTLRRIPIKTHGPSGMHPVLNIDVVIRILIERLRKPDEPWVDTLLECMPLRHQLAVPRRAQRRQASRAARAQRQNAADEEAEEDVTDDECSATSSDGDGDCVSNEAREEGGKQVDGPLAAHHAT